MLIPKISSTDTRTNFNGTFISPYKALSPVTQKYFDEARPAIDKMIKKEPFDLYMHELHNKGESIIIRFKALSPKQDYNRIQATAYTTNRGQMIAKLYESAAKDAITHYKRKFLHKDNWFIKTINKLTKYFN